MDGGFGGTITDPLPVRRDGRVVKLV